MISEDDEWKTDKIFSLSVGDNEGVFCFGLKNICVVRNGVIDFYERVDDEWKFESINFPLF